MLLRHARSAGRLVRTLAPLRSGQLTSRVGHVARTWLFGHVPSLLPHLLGDVRSLPRIVPGQAWLIARARTTEAALRRTLEHGTVDAAGHEVRADAWSDHGLLKLVRYHLHYLDAARDVLLGSVSGGVPSPEAEAWALALMRRWIEDNPPGASEGWEPYPVAARLQALCMCAGVLSDRSPEWLRAQIALHARFLIRWPERHLQGNHLLKDWVCVALAGAMCNGDEADEWRRRGLEEVRRELSEQVLADGGHEERSPMYQLLVLDDLLDLRDALQTRGSVPPWLAATIDRMAVFSAELRHPDGDIPFFNDAVIGQAPAPEIVLRRAGVTGSSTRVFDAPITGVTVVRGEPGEALFFDSGPLGPPHQPGHAHSDTFSFELSVRGRRLAVNGGVDGYQTPQRAYFRSAAAKNTVTVGGEGPDELWGQFRVGGRSRVLRRSVDDRGPFVVLCGTLESFQGWVHHRSLIFVRGIALIVRDEIEGAHGRALESRVRLLGDTHLQPLIGSVAPVSAPYAPRFGELEYREQHVFRSPDQTIAYVLRWDERPFPVKVQASTIEFELAGQHQRIECP